MGFMFVLPYDTPQCVCDGEWSNRRLGIAHGPKSATTAVQPESTLLLGHHCNAGEKTDTCLTRYVQRVCGCCEVVTSVVAHLGGPDIDATELDWALDVPEGKDLLEWLASQFIDLNDLKEDSDDAETRIKASLRKIAFEAEELQILERAQDAGLSVNLDDLDNINVAVASNKGYTVPSELQYSTPVSDLGHCSYTLTFPGSLSHTCRRSKSYFGNQRAATQNTVKETKILQHALDNAQETVKRREEELAELSLHADQVISSAVRQARRTIHELRVPASSTTHSADAGSHPYQHPMYVKRILSNISSLHSSASQLLESSPSTNFCMTPMQLQMEASRLQAALSPEALAAAREVAYKEEVKRMCERLENGETTVEDELQRAKEHLSLLDADEDSDHGWEDIDIQAELENAWRADQMALLSAREDLLNEVKIFTEQDLLPPLVTMHGLLIASDAHVRESAAVLIALHQELEGIVDDLHTQERQSHGEVVDDNEKFMSDIAAKLRELQNFRAVDASPLVLLNSADVITELESLVARARSSEEEETAWVSALPAKLSSLEAELTPLLTTVYTHSPVTTSEPFALPSDIARSENMAREAVERMAEDIAKLQKKIEVDGRVRKKLDAFVEAQS